MNQLPLRYGVNPNQTPAKVYINDGELPFEVLNGRPGYINLLDALNSYALVRELYNAFAVPAAASFKHVSPAGAAIGLPLSETERQVFFAPEGDVSPQACAYIRARGADRVSSYGDWAALSGVCDADTARFLQPEVSDGVIASDYTTEALEILKTKRKGNYTILKMNPDFDPKTFENRDVFGVTFEQPRNNKPIDESMLANVVTVSKEIPDSAKRDLIIAMIALKYTQSNSVAYAKDGGCVGIGAGQQSRIHCTRLAGNKADNFRLRSHPIVLALPFLPNISRPARDNAIDLYISSDPVDTQSLLSDGKWQDVFTVCPEPLPLGERLNWLASSAGLSLASDAFFPFGDNIERAHRSGVSYIAQPGGSIRDDNVIEVCDKYGIAMAFTGLRLFTH